MAAGDYDITDAHHVVVLGDLNSRLDGSQLAPSAVGTLRESIRAQWLVAADAIQRSDWGALLVCDEAQAAMRGGAEGHPLHGFLEAPVTFAPTYKLQRGGQPGDMFSRYSSKRLPGYTDRILWRTAEGAPALAAELYTSGAACTSSDHCPVALHLALEGR